MAFSLEAGAVYGAVEAVADCRLMVVSSVPQVELVS